jgi:hypothetical protein
MRDATHYAPPGARSAAHGAEWCPSNPALWTAPVPFDPGVPVAGEPIEVFANEGRWIAQCPDRACRSAQLACKTDPRFMCHECANRENAGKWLPLKWPRNVGKIEALLAKRVVVNQNWLPGETLKDLLADNLEHGISR